MLGAVGGGGGLSECVMIIINILNSKIFLIFYFFNYFFSHAIQSRKNSKSWGRGNFIPL